MPFGHMTWKTSQENHNTYKLSLEICFTQRNQDCFLYILRKTHFYSLQHFVIMQTVVMHGIVFFFFFADASKCHFSAMRYCEIKKMTNFPHPLKNFVYLVVEQAYAFFFQEPNNKILS